MPHDDAFASPDSLLRHAAAADAAHAVELLGRISATRLLDLVVTQAELAVDEERPRAAGIDAVGDLARAAVEIMDLPQDTDLDDDEDGHLEPPTVTGWELVTVTPGDLDAATLALPVSPWLLALVAFEDHVEDGPDGDAVEGGPAVPGRPDAEPDTEVEGPATVRRVVGAAADGRIAAARLRLVDPLEDADVLAAAVSRDPADLGSDADLASSLLAALQAAARGR